MTIQRQYTLPNCNLVLEGLSANANDPLSPLSVLMNVECQLPGATDATLTGGREFLDSLVAAVSRYAQQQLSDVGQPPTASGAAPPLVDLKPGEGPYHHLIVRQQNPGESPQDTEAMAPLDVRLSTVQFYDLMEAIDQLLADNQTLPDLQPSFQAISRRMVKPAEPATKRAAPAVIGAAALAAASIGLFFVPPPEFEPSRSSQETSTVDDASAPGSGQDEASPTGNDPTDSEPQSNLDATDPAVAAAEIDRLANAPAIAAPTLLSTLQQDLRRQLEADWTVEPVPQNDWTYRVAVAENGDILGYKYVNRVALDNVGSTPLHRLAFEPVDETQAVQEPVAQFEVTFTPDGQVEVVPWGAAAANADARDADPEGEAESPEADSPEIEPAATEAAEVNRQENAQEGDLQPLETTITDADTIRTLNSILYDTILSDLVPLSANEPLEYQVRISKGGTIVGYEPLNAAAVLLADETPLPNLVAPAGGAEPQADYRVVFTEAGVLEVSPWDGWPD